MKSYYNRREYHNCYELYEFYASSTTTTITTTAAAAASVVDDIIKQVNSCCAANTTNQPAIELAISSHYQVQNFKAWQLGLG